MSFTFCMPLGINELILYRFDRLFTHHIQKKKLFFIPLKLKKIIIGISGEFFSVTTMLAYLRTVFNLEK